MHEVHPLRRAIGGGERVLLRPAALKGVLPAGLVVDGVIQPQQVVPIGADVPRLLGQQTAGVLVQPAGDGLVRLLRAHGHAVGGREVPVRQRVHGLLVHIGVLPQECAVGQAAHRLVVVGVDADPQILDLLAQRLRVTGIQQLHDLLLRVAVSDLCQHGQGGVQADGRVHPVLAVGEDRACRSVGKGQHRRGGLLIQPPLAQLLHRRHVFILRRHVGVPVSLAVIVEVVLVPRLAGIGREGRFLDGIPRQVHGSASPLLIVRPGLYGAACQQCPRQQGAKYGSQSLHGKFLLFFQLPV